MASYPHQALNFTLTSCLPDGNRSQKLKDKGEAVHTLMDVKEPIPPHTPTQPGSTCGH